MVVNYRVVKKWQRIYNICDCTCGDYIGWSESTSIEGGLMRILANFICGAIHQREQSTIAKIFKHYAYHCPHVHR